MNEEIIEAYLKIMPVIKDILMEDIAVCVTDNTKFLYYRAGDTIDMKVNVGSKIPADDPLYKAIKDGKRYSILVPKEVYGFPFKAIVYPIKDSSGKVIGGVGIGRSLAERYKLEEATDKLFSSLKETNAGIEEISSGAQSLLNMISDIVDNSKQAAENIKESNEIITMIQSIASQSNLLGLNAAIEAARSGEHGKGFTVVASEMRKLAQLSSESSQKVFNSLSKINKSMEEIFNIINDVQGVSEGQAAATQEITAVLEKIISNAQMLVEISKVK